MDSTSWRGEAVYRARAILGIDVDDTELAYRINHVPIETKSDSISKFLIYPNPTKGKFTIEFDKFVSNPIELTIYDEIGRIIRVVKSNSNIKRFDFDLSDSGVGIYTVKIKDQFGFENYNKIVIIK
jgi:hypothetical protein